MKYRVLVFFAVQVFIAVLVWIGGFNFDHRSSLVAYGFFVSVFVGVGVAAYPFLPEWFEKDKP